MNCLIPLRNRHCEIIAHSQIDQEDFEKVNKFKWHLDDGYAKGARGFLHRFILDAKKTDSLVDHLNAQNRKKKEECTSKYIGISFDKNSQKWRCSIKINSKSKTIRFKQEEHAAWWHDQLTLQYYGSDAKINGIEKPDDFIEPIEKTRDLPKGIRLTRIGNYDARMNDNKKSISIGTFKTIEEALEALNIKKEELKQSKEQERLSSKIIRNEDEIAVIGKVLVDDDKYHELIQYSWHNNRGYAQAKIDIKIIKMHRYLLNAKEDELVDHINNNKLDNRIVNLRISNPSSNSHNKGKKEGSTSKYTGVCLYKKNGKYKAGISKENKYYWLGYHITAEEAALAYNEKAKELYGTHARLNIIPEI
jgi:hypothetical protein